MIRLLTAIIIVILLGSKVFSAEPAAEDFGHGRFEVNLLFPPGATGDNIKISLVSVDGDLEIRPDNTFTLKKPDMPVAVISVSLEKDNWKNVQNKEESFTPFKIWVPFATMPLGRDMEFEKITLLVTPTVVDGSINSAILEFMKLGQRLDRSGAETEKWRFFQLSYKLTRRRSEQFFGGTGEEPNALDVIPAYYFVRYSLDLAERGVEPSNLYWDAVKWIDGLLSAPDKPYFQKGFVKKEDAEDLVKRANEFVFESKMMRPIFDAMDGDFAKIKNKAAAADSRVCREYFQLGRYIKDMDVQWIIQINPQASIQYDLENQAILGQEACLSVDARDLINGVAKGTAEELVAKKKKVSDTIANVLHRATIVHSKVANGRLKLLLENLSCDLMRDWRDLGNSSDEGAPDTPVSCATS